MKTIKTLSLILIMAFSMLMVNAQKHRSNNNIDTLINAYLGIKNALSANDGTVAHYKAQEFFKIMSSQPDKGLSGDQKKLVVEYIDKLLFDSRHMMETVEVAHQREHFANL